MMELSRDEAIRLHRELWNRLADKEEAEHRFVSKKEILDDMGITEPVIHDCFACEFCSQICEDCPIDWGFTHRRICCSNSYYNEWYNATYHYVKQDLIESVRLARIIANLPEWIG